MDVLPDEMLLKSTDDVLIQKYMERNAPSKKVAKSPEKPIMEKPEKTEKPAKEKMSKRSGPSVWDGIFRFLLKLIDFILKALGKIFTFLLFKPAKKYWKWMMKKKIRILYTAVFILIVYILIVNWPIIEGLLENLKF
jgi:hypothetical protein